MKKRRNIIACIACLLLCASCGVHAESKPNRTTPILDVEVLYPKNIHLETMSFKTCFKVEKDYTNIVQSTFLGQRVNFLSDENSSVSIFREGISLVPGVSYTLSYRTTAKNPLHVKISVLDSLGNIVYSNGYDTQYTENNAVQFSYGSYADYNGKLYIEVESSEANRFLLDKLELRASSNNTIAKVSQMGYETNSEKLVIFPYNVGDYFNVIDEETNNVVYTGQIGNRKENEETGEVNYVGDFSSVKVPGKYRIEAQFLATSYSFEIADNIFTSLLDDSLKMITLQRCGEELDASWAGLLAHPECHTSLATILSTNEKIDVSGGWHDAGDYGRYVLTSTKTVSDLLLAYMDNASVFSDNINIEESNNGIPDILDEAKYELDWLLKMQNPKTGGVYNKVVSAGFAKTVLPQKDYQDLYVLPELTTSTGDFAAVMALAYSVYKPLDEAFAQKCLESSLLAWQYLQDNPDYIEILNPGYFDAGEYRNKSDQDERFYAAVALWNATGEEGFLQAAKEIFGTNGDELNELSWNKVGAYGQYLFLRNPNAKEEEEFYQNVYNQFMHYANQIETNSADNPYRIAINYSWGGNMDAADNAVYMLMANKIDAKQKYVNGAYNYIYYLVGRNSLNQSYITGYGNTYPQNIHHRITMVTGGELKGAMVGGPDAIKEDPATLSYMSSSTPIAKRYLDFTSSYSTNEVAIYWNSGLTYALSFLENQ